MMTPEPDRGSCNAHVLLRGAGFPPGKQISIGAWPIVPYYEDVGYGLENGPVVAADGTFTVGITPLNFGCRSGALQLVISAGVWPHDGVTPAVSARYTISSAPAPFPSGPYLAAPVTPTAESGMPTPVTNPPPATLAYGNQIQAGALGNYCWRAGWSAVGGACVERGLPIPVDALAAPRGATLLLVIDSGGYMAVRPASAYPLAAQHQTPVAPASVTLPVSRSAPPTTFTMAVDLPAGEYGIVVQVLPSWGGEVTYGFHVLVR